MRTTITLDDDLAEALKSLARERDQPIKRVINDTLRSGIERQRPALPRFRQATSPMGLRPDIDLTKALALATAMEDEELRLKLEQGR